jgi:hypothetical protein
MSTLDTYFWKMLDAYLEDYFVDHENTNEGLTEEEIEDLMNNPNWTGSRCHY